MASLAVSESVVGDGLSSAGLAALLAVRYVAQLAFEVGCRNEL
jgi:hypothetical protein